MKLLIFCPYYPPHIGGLESHADEFNKYLSQKGATITVFTPRIPQSASEKEIKYSKAYSVKSSKASATKREFNGVKIIRFPAWEIIPNYPLPKFWSYKFWKLFIDLFKQKFDITISRTRFFTTSLMALVYAKIKKTQWVHIEHGSDFVQLSSKFKSFIAKVYDYTFGWLIFNCSDLNISISEAVQKFVYKFNKRKSPIIKRGIDIDAIAKIKTNLRIKNKYTNKIIIGFVGRLIDGKGVHDLINSLTKIKLNNFICLIIGDGPQERQLKKMVAENNLQKKVIFLGKMPHNKTMAIMKTFDIFVNPSYTEGLPTSILEASLCKNAIIATNVGGTNEIITNNQNGYLIEPKNIELLKDKIINLIKNSAKRQIFSKNACQYVKSNFNWEKSIKKYEEKFKKILVKKYNK